MTVSIALKGNTQLATSGAAVAASASKVINNSKGVPLGTVSASGSYVYASKVRADAKRDLLKRPLIQAPLWTASEVFPTVESKRRHSNGQLMKLVVAGTTGSTEPLFSSTRLMVDGTATWAWTGRKSRVNTDGYPVPTVTVNNTAPSTAVGTATFATNIMTVATVTSGAYAVGDIITATGVAAGTFISSFGTGTGAEGTYNLSTSPGTLAIRAATANLAVEKLLYDTTTPGPIGGGAITAGGTGFTNGTYTNVPFVNLSGTGVGGVLNSVTVAGGIVTAVVTTPVGTGDGYVYNNTLTVAATELGGTGSGFIFTVNRVWSNPSAFPFVLQSECSKISSIQNAYSQGLVVNNGGSVGGLNYGMRTIEFICDEPFISLTTFNIVGQRNQVFVDGYLVEEDTTQSTSAVSHYKINWNGLRELRKYRVEVSLQVFRGICIQANSVIYAPEDTGLKGVYFGDSFQGTISTYSLPMSSDLMAHQIFKRTGIMHFRNIGIGGTGYVTGKAVDDKNSTATGYTCRAAMINNPPTGTWGDAASVVFAHGINDQGTSPAVICAEAIVCWTLARTQYPLAFFHIYGPWPENSGPSATVLALDTALAAAVTAWGDKNAQFHSTTQGPQGSWTVGTGKLGTPTGVGNADWLVGADGTHSTVLGAEIYIERMVECQEADLSSILL